MITSENKDLTIEYKFEPSEELIEFADNFSKNCLSLSVGDYNSNNDKYKIKYVDKIKDKYGFEPTTYIRIGHNLKIIEISKSKIINHKNISTDLIFFLIIWCIVQLEVDNIIKSDEITLKYYLSTNRPIKDFYVSFVNMMKMSSSKSIDRVREFHDIINKYKNNENNI